MCWLLSYKQNMQNHKFCNYLQVNNEQKKFLLFSYLFLNLHMVHVIFLNLNLFKKKNKKKPSQMTGFVYISKKCDFCMSLET